MIRSRLWMPFLLDFNFKKSCRFFVLCEPFVVTCDPITAKGVLLKCPKPHAFNEKVNWVWVVGPSLNTLLCQDSIRYTEVPEIQDVQHSKRTAPSLTAQTPGSNLLIFWWGILGTLAIFEFLHRSRSMNQKATLFQGRNSKISPVPLIVPCCLSHFGHFCVSLIAIL